MNRYIRIACYGLIPLLMAISAQSADPKQSTTTTPLSDIRTPQFDDTSLVNRYAKENKIAPISLNFTDIKVRELLQIIAQFTQLNFVINEDVKGNMSIHLHQVPWTQALDVILKSQNLGERRVGDVVYIAPLDSLLKQKIDEMQAHQKISELVPLKDQIIHLNYADSTEIQKILVAKDFSLLSSRGSTNADPRTNSIWIHDTPEHVKTVTQLIRELDFPVKQVMIEARIVSVRRRFERQLGARFGVTKPSHITGTLPGANSLAGGTSINNVTLADRLNFDVRANGSIFGSTSAPGSIGLAVSQIGSNFVDLELSALEEQNDLDIISSPRLVTSNQQKAYIKTGEEIPYQAASSSGATAVEFKEAELKLEVTPQITPDNRVMLNLKVSNNRAGTPVALSGGGSSIPIDTEEEESRVLLNDHQTVILGGIYRRNKANVVRRVPFLGSIPLLGLLFKNTVKSTDKRELLIFLTPHIIHKPSDLSSVS